MKLVSWTRRFWPTHRKLSSSQSTTKHWHPWKRPPMAVWCISVHLCATAADEEFRLRGSASWTRRECTRSLFLHWKPWETKALRCYLQEDATSQYQGAKAYAIIFRGSSKIMLNSYMRYLLNRPKKEQGVPFCEGMPSSPVLLREKVTQHLLRRALWKEPDSA